MPCALMKGGVMPKIQSRLRQLDVMATVIRLVDWTNNMLGARTRGKTTERLTTDP